MNSYLLKEGRHTTHTDYDTETTTEALSLNGLTVHRSPLIKTHNIVLKRVLDIVISVAVILCLLSWLLPVLALLIKIDSSGPVFFLQKRNSKNGRFFYCIKLRTMVVNRDADTLTATLNDQRITGLGRFLRISHLDELPQFLNVLAGSMSVIGPRPHMFSENVRYNSMFSYYNDRHFVKPGITGLAQSLGYNGPITSFYQIEKKVAYDIFYINNWTLMMDIKIMARTVAMIYRKFI